MAKGLFSRRLLLKLMAAGLLGAIAIPRLFKRASSSGPVQHILPAVTHNQFLIKVSFLKPKTAVQLSVSGPWQDNLIAGQQTDSHGRFWMFQVSGLAPDTSYSLQLQDSTSPIADAWPLKTFPAPNAQPQSLKLLCYTCAGGPDGFAFPGGKEIFKPHHVRQTLFDSALEMKPDAAVAIGDHIYWDLRGSDSVTLSAGLFGQIVTWYLQQVFGAFDRSAEIIGNKSANEKVLTAIGDDQIANLYGTKFKSTPMFFVPDDHDYFENDDADIGTFPADSFSRRAHAAMAHLYYPSFMSSRPEFPGTDSEGNNRSFGTFRFGDLVEVPMVDCAGYLTLAEGGDQSVLFPSAVEDWLLSKIASNQTQHFGLIPSHPLGWTAGKWREWYPDVVAPDAGFTGLVENKLMANVQGVLSAKAQKALWQTGWWLQHQRLITAIADNQKRPTILLSGDIHALGAKTIEASSEIDLSHRPIQTVLVGSVSTSTLAWPSAARSIPAASPEWLQTSDHVATTEDNGFTMIEFSRHSIVATLVNCGGGPQSSDAALTSEKGAALTKTEIVLT
jgi:phosphodiesterase/alkaline phosphatase D-like protein